MFFKMTTFTVFRKLRITSRQIVELPELLVPVTDLRHSGKYSVGSNIVNGLCNLNHKHKMFQNLLSGAYLEPFQVSAIKLFA